MAQPATSLRSGALLAAAILLALSAFALGSFAPTIRQTLPAGRSAASTETLRVVHDFYAAADLAIATGKVDDLDRIIATTFTEFPARLGKGTPRDQLAQSLLALRSQSPQVELLIEAVVPTDASNVVLVRLSVAGASSRRFLGRDANDWGPMGWGPIDVLRVDGGQVVERRSGGSTPVLMWTIADATLPMQLSSGAQTFSLVRIALPSHATARIVNGLTSRMFVVERGSVVLMSEPPNAAPQLKPDLPITQPTSTPSSQPLKEGETAVTTPGDNRLLRNAGDSPASLLLVVRYGSPPAPGASTDPVLSDVKAIVEGSDPGVVADVLATASAANNRETRVAVGRFTFPSGVALDWPSTGGSMIVAVEDGQVSIAGVEPGQERPSYSTLGPGAAQAMSTRDEATWIALEHHPATVLVMTLSNSVGPDQSDRVEPTT